MNPTNFSLTNAGPALRTIREAVGISVETLAYRLGWSIDQLNQIESNVVAVRMSELDAINTALNLRPDTILMSCLRTKFPQLEVMV